MPSKETKSCLIITYGPVPTPEYQTVEGGGMRVWGLAKGLAANGVDVTVGVNASFPQKLGEHEDVRLINWTLDDAFADIINTYDTVIMSYCMGDPSVFVVDRIQDNVQLVLDAYVPIYVEVSARESNDIDTEYSAYMSDIVRFNKVLKRGDYFLCANEAQKTFYTGVLSALGIINPRSYREERLLVVPFGIHDTPAVATKNPYVELGVTKNDFVVLWFGGLYPWFHIEELLGSLLALSKYEAIKFVFVGGKNPFNPNPDFFKQYEKTVAFAKEHGLFDKSVFFVDWVDFEDRINWYKHADVVISLNRPGEENRYSWRTRVMDYVWGELPIITNGGDPLSEDLIRDKAALRLPELTTDAITQSIVDSYDNNKLLQELRESVKGLKPRYYWHTVTKPLGEVIQLGSAPYQEEDKYKTRLGVSVHESVAFDNPMTQGKLQKIMDVTPRVISKVRKKGILRSAKLATGIAKTQVKKRRLTQNHKRYVFISHPMDNTGAPLVLLQMVEEYAHKYGASNVQLVAPGIEPHILNKLHKLGVKVDKAVSGLGFRFIRLQLGLRENDFVLMNTVAIYDNYRDFILLWLKTGRLKHAYWFIHEDKDQLPVIHKEFLYKNNLNQMHSLLSDKKLSVLVPSKRTRDEYNELLETKEVKTINLHVEVHKKYHGTHKPRDYQKINFLLQGTPSDGRKGHMLVLAAFKEFLAAYYYKSPEEYRDFSLHLVSIGNDYISQQVKIVGRSVLGSRLHIYPSVPKEEVLEIYSKCNAVICSSLNETFGLYVAEGMFMGHIVLRNNSAGMDEQLKDGFNGFFIDHTDIKQFASVIEKLLNKKSFSDDALQKMGVASQKIISEYSTHTYLTQVEDLEKS